MWLPVIISILVVVLTSLLVFFKFWKQEQKSTSNSSAVEPIPEQILVEETISPQPSVEPTVTLQQTTPVDSGAESNLLKPIELVDGAEKPKVFIIYLSSFHIYFGYVTDNQPIVKPAIVETQSFEDILGGVRYRCIQIGTIQPKNTSLYGSEYHLLLEKEEFLDLALYKLLEKEIKEPVKIVFVVREIEGFNYSEVINNVCSLKSSYIINTKITKASAMASFMFDEAVYDTMIHSDDDYTLILDETRNVLREDNRNVSINTLINNQLPLQNIALNTNQLNVLKQQKQRGCKHFLISGRSVSFGSNEFNDVICKGDIEPELLPWFGACKYVKLLEDNKYF